MMLVAKKDAVIGNVIRKLDAANGVANGHWMPFYLFPSMTGSTVEDQDRRIRAGMARSTPKENKRVLEYSMTSLCRVSGFGQTSGDFNVFTHDKRVRCPGSGLCLAAPAASCYHREDIGIDDIEIATATTVATAAIAARDEMQKVVEPEVTIPQTREELVALFDEEFPQLTDSYRTNLDYLDQSRREKGKSRD